MSSKDRITKATAAVGAIATTMRLYSDYKLKWDARRQWSITIEEGNYLYIPILRWLSSNIDGARHFSLYHVDGKLYTGQNARKELKFNLGGHEVKMEAPQDKPTVESNAYGELDVKKQSITFVAKSEGGLTALMELFEKLRVEKSTVKRQVMGNNCNSYGWVQRPLPRRFVDKIFLPSGVKERLMSDIERFLASEDDYAAIGSPWHRGYLLYGPPGNGKTSLVQALAHYYEKDVYNLPLSVINSDSQLLERLSQMDRNSFLLVEDIDIFKESVKRDNQNKNGPTLAGLLNAFDGINTPNGLVTFFTTNEKDTLDRALVRAGRMDMHIELKAPTHTQIKDMFEGIYDEPLGLTAKESKKFGSMADFANVLKDHLGDAEGARLEVKVGD